MERNEYRAMVSKLHTSINEEEIIMNQRHTNKPRAVGLLIAAALVVALAVGAVAAYRAGLQDLVLRSSAPPAPGTQTAEPVETPQSQSYDPLPGDRDTISLQGFADSPEYQAALAWAEFQHGYDRDGEELKKVGNRPTGFEEKYNFNGYSVYTQEMADKIDEITAQYGLALHSGGMQFGTVAELEERFGDFLSTDQYGGYFFKDGTFQCDCNQDGIDFQLRRSMKGVLDTVTLNINDADQFEQWEYQTECGETVLLALGPQKALILADLEDAFVAVNILAGTQTPPAEVEGVMNLGPVTAQWVETLADSINFSLF